MSHLVPNENRPLCFLAKRLERPGHQIVAAEDLSRMVDENEVVASRGMSIQHHSPMVFDHGIHDVRRNDDCPVAAVSLRNLANRGLAFGENAYITDQHGGQLLRMSQGGVATDFADTAAAMSIARGEGAFGDFLYVGTADGKVVPAVMHDRLSIGTVPP